MAALTRCLLKTKPLGSLTGVQLTRAAGNWNKDWKPSPFPVTPEERAAAARKYGLRPEEYKPYPDDGLGYGDYPDVPLVSAESRDPYGNWDYPEHRRNFGEPIHADFEMYGLDRVNASQKLRFSPRQQALTFFAVMAGFMGIYFLLEDNKMHWPHLPKQYPQEGVVHYTFEPAE
ncbi:NADH dehydrogenase [ubiquinone] 1 beta subcomplex subunit 8, mitochondrial-like [Homarus americanus]|uniref:NADH dehydrogenase [ubiquinone] 1 beta subcomplex subunit 8, mitochondrial-like n=1 Tax=Homarus americanus TaxID=6706 RepID=UPI001C4847DC|nr:NADH dehydrogenase [ubiquinone] 1 beta subcomplex subunit 8, mitochondrial-like [Homarus americanus]